MKLLLVGKNGQIGFELQRALAPLGDVVAVGRAQCDLREPAAIRRLVRATKPQIIVNPAGYTDVDGAESDKKIAFAVNSTAPGIFGEEAKRLGALVVHYSTDYVFDGGKDGTYTECDPPNPQNIYGLSKLQGEQALQSSGADNIIFRTSWVFGAHGANFVKTMLNLAASRDNLSVVNDQFGVPTSASLVADVTAQILGQYIKCGNSHFPLGLYHMVATSGTQRHAFAQAIIGDAIAAGIRLRLTPEAILPVTSAEYPVAAKRPANSRMNNAKLRNTFGLHLPDWRVGLHHTLQQILNAI